MAAIISVADQNRVRQSGLMFGAHGLSSVVRDRER
jgi:hypothetical protein